MASHEQEISQAITRIALAGDGAVLGLGLAVIAIRTWLKYNSNSKALAKVQATPVSRIRDLRMLLSDDKGTEQLVMVRGEVQPTAFAEATHGEGVLTTPNSGDEAVIFLKSQTCLYNEWRGLFGWSSDLRSLFGGSLKEQVTLSMRKVPFVLIESEGLQKFSHVHINLDNSRHPLPLTTVYHNLQPVDATPYTVFQAIFGRGYPVGLLDEEKILAPGKQITAIGHLHKTQNGQPGIKSCKSLPHFLTYLTKDQLVEELAIGKAVLFWSGIVISTVAIGVLTYAAFRNWRRFIEYWKRRRQAQLPTVEPNISNGVDDESGELPDGELCVVCLMRRRRCAFIPCGHLVCCSRCVASIR
ncbi:hypothetical protein SUGI_0194080 [Cryptomeria japonica]|nr:hypothetical protein SUGI_0194080 [Cryptomeria japonica]